MNTKRAAYALLLLATAAGLVGGCGRDGELATNTVAPTETATSAPAEADAAEPRDGSPARQPTPSAAPSPSVTATGAPANPPPRCAPPAVVGVTTTPALPIKDGWLVLPDAAGTVTFTVRATGASEVQFRLTPTGTDTASLATLLGTDRTAQDGFTLTWSYPNQPLLSHFSVVATSPCGRAETSPFNVYHD